MKYFKHGDLTSAADLNALVNLINSIETQTGLSSYGVGCKDAEQPGVVFHGVHSKRYLLYRSTGEVRDVNDPTNEDRITVLPDCNAPFCVFDLHDVPWLKYGDVIEVEGSEFALETDVNA